MTRRLLGAHLRGKAPKLDEGVSTFQPQLDISEKELWARVAIKDDNIGLYKADFSAQFRRRSEISRALATAFVGISNGRRKATVENIERYLKLFLGPFLDGIQNTFGINVISLNDVNDKVIEHFHEWLNGKLIFSQKNRRPKNDYKRISFGAIYRCLKRAFDYLRSSSTWRDKLDSNLHFKSNPAPGAHKEVQHRTPLTETDMRLIRNACQTEIAATLEKLNAGMEARKRQAAQIDFGSKTATTFRSLEDSISAYMHAEEMGYFSEELLKGKMPGFARATRGLHFTKQYIREHLHFTAETIVPFVLMIEMEFVFAVDSHLMLKWSSMSDSVTGTRFRFDVQKHRGDVTQIKTFKKNDRYIFSADSMLRQLKLHSSRTKDLIGDKFKDCVFIFVDGFGRPKGFSSQNDSGLFRHNLLAFIKRNNLPHFTLAQLRPTVSTLTGADILSTKLLLNQEKLATTEESYESSQSKVLRREAIGFELSVRERMITTGGRIDTRGSAQSRREKTAATPGFGCLNPLASPLEGQVVGKMCTAYGRCPACPNAFLDTTSSRAAFRLAQLLELLNNLRLSCAEPRWLKYWHQQVLFLQEVWLPAFSVDVVTAAANLKLSPLPEID